MDDTSNPKLQPGKTLLIFPLVSEVAELPLPSGQKAFATLKIAGNTIHIMNYTKESPRVIAENLLKVNGYPFTDSAKPTGWKLGRIFNHISEIPNFPAGTCWEIINQEGQLIGYAFRNGEALLPNQISELTEIKKKEQPGSPDDLLTFNAFNWIKS
jgi:hypothetical protein